MHTIFFGVSLALIGFEPMFYNMWLALLAYSCYLTLNNCTICCYVTFLTFAITGGLTWGIAYTGSGGAEVSCDRTAAGIAADKAAGKTEKDSSCTHNNNGSLNGGLSGTQSIALFTCIGMYILMFYLVGRALWYFRKTGGIRGLN